MSDQDRDSRYVTHAEFAEFARANDERLGGIERWLQTGFAEIKATLSETTKTVYSSGKFNPAWMIAGAGLLVAVVGASASGVLFAVQAFVAPVAVRVDAGAALAEDMDARLRDRGEMAVRNDERWQLYLEGRLKGDPE